MDRLYEHETLDDLQWGGLRLIQNKKLFCFGTDAVLLAHFVRTRGEKVLCDLGCGNGIISVLLGGKNPQLTVYGLEIQPELQDLAIRNVRLNGLDNVHIIRGDIRQASKLLPRATCVVANPPYDKPGTGILPQNESQRIARYELTVTFEELAASAAKLLGDGGRFYLIHKAARIEELLAQLSEKKLHAKELRFIHPTKDKEASLVLICAKKGGSAALRVQPPLVLYENGHYTPEVARIYQGE